MDTLDTTAATTIDGAAIEETDRLIASDKVEGASPRMGSRELNATTSGDDSGEENDHRDDRENDTHPQKEAQ